MNKDIEKRESLIELLKRFNLTIIGNESKWLLVTNESERFVDHEFKSISEMNVWSRKHLQKLADQELLKSGKSKAGGLQMGMFDDDDV